MSVESSILVGCVGSVAWVRIEGSANHENTPCIREFLYGRFEQGWYRFVVDLGNCRGIDSTFIGMLYGLAGEVDKGGWDGFVEVINPGQRNERSIRKLGLDRLIRIDPRGASWQEERKLVEQNLEKPRSCPNLAPRERAQMILEAHQALIEANAENESRFCDVVEFLKQDLESRTAEG